MKDKKRWVWGPALLGALCLLLAYKSYPEPLPKDFKLVSGTASRIEYKSEHRSRGPVNQRLEISLQETDKAVVFRYRGPPSEYQSVLDAQRPALVTITYLGDENPRVIWGVKVNGREVITPAGVHRHAQVFAWKSCALGFGLLLFAAAIARFVQSTPMGPRTSAPRAAPQAVEAKTGASLDNLFWRAFGLAVGVAWGAALTRLYYLHGIPKKDMSAGGMAYMLTGLLVFFLGVGMAGATAGLAATRRHPMARLGIAVSMVLLGAISCSVF